MKFYRVELILPNGEREGPYATPLIELAGITSAGSDVHPGPSDDALLQHAWYHLMNLSQHRKYFFGFNSISQYQDWFHFEAGRVNMAMNDGVLAVYEVPDEYMFEGDKQCVAHGDFMEHLYDLHCYADEDTEDERVTEDA